MKSRIALVCVALATVFIVACPMPHIGVAPTRDAAGGTDQSAPVAAGASISVVMDDARSQAVYINETGQRFDVAAAEYPGGPLVACVQVADFTLVPPSTDSDALPVKALVAGMRSDGSPGVWEIHTDDSIDLPQPEVTDPTGARCIVGGDMPSLPDGVQMRNGWGFHVTAVSPDGRMLVGYADNPRGVTIGGTQILPGTTIGIYWRVYSLLGNRFCIVSAPHIIGTFVKAPLPPKWAAHWPGRSQLLEQLRLYFVGTLQSYLTKATSVRLDVPQGTALAAATSTGTYDVFGTNEDGLPAEASIDKSGGVTIQVEVPDLAVSAVTVTTASGAAPATTSDLWSVSASLVNEGTAAAVPVTVQYWLSTSAAFDPTAATLLDTSTLTSLQPGATTTVTSPRQYSLDNLKLAAGTYSVVVTVATDPKLGEIDLTDNTAQASISVSAATTATNVDLAVSVSTAGPVPLTGTWSFTATVTNLGTGTAGPSTLDYVVNGTATPVPVGSILPGASLAIPLTGSVSALTTAPGTYRITVVADAANALADTNRSNNTAVAAIPVMYPELVIDTYDPLDPMGPGATFSTKVELWQAGGAFALGSDDGSVVPSLTRPLSYPNQQYALLDYTKGLAPGDYYILVEASSPGDTFEYGIRVTTALDSSYDGWTFATAVTETASDQPLQGPPSTTAGYQELSLNNTSTTPPTPSAGNHLNRFIVPNGVNWMKITLP